MQKEGSDPKATDKCVSTALQIELKSVSLAESILYTKLIEKICIGALGKFPSVCSFGLGFLCSARRRRRARDGRERKSFRLFSRLVKLFILLIEKL